MCRAIGVYEALTLATLLHMSWLPLLILNQVNCCPLKRISAFAPILFFPRYIPPFVVADVFLFNSKVSIIPELSHAVNLHCVK